MALKSIVAFVTLWALAFSFDETSPWMREYNGTDYWPNYDNGTYNGTDYWPDYNGTDYWPEYDNGTHNGTDYWPGHNGTDSWPEFRMFNDTDYDTINGTDHLWNNGTVNGTSDYDY